MEEDNKIKINTGSKHFDISSKGGLVNLRSEVKLETDRSEREEVEFFKKRNAKEEAERNAKEDDFLDKKEKSSERKTLRSKRSSRASSLRSIFLSHSEKREIFDKVILGLIYFLVFTLPLFILPFSMEIYEFNKTILLFVISSLAFLVWITKMILIDKKIVFVKTALDVPIASFLSLALISTAFSLDKVSSLLGFYGRFSDSLMVSVSLAMLYFVIVNYVTLRQEGSAVEDGVSLENAQNDIKNNLLKIFLASSFVVVVAGLLYSFGFRFIPWTETQFRSFNLVAGSANILGIYLTSVIMIALYYRNTASFSSSGSIGKNLMSFLIIISIILLAIIDFILAWIILAVSLAISLLLIFVIRRQQEIILPLKSIFLFPILLILVSSVFILTSLIAFNNKVEENLQSSSISSSIKGRLLSSNADEIPDADRFSTEVVLDKETALAVAVEGLRDDPIAGAIGSGPGTYLYNFSKFKPAKFNKSNYWNVKFDKAGSEIIEKISTAGVLGTFSYLLIIFFAMMTFWKTINFRNAQGEKIFARLSENDKNLSASSRAKMALGDYSFVYLFVAWFGLLLAQFFYLESTTTKFLFWLFTAILVLQYFLMQRRLESSMQDSAPVGESGVGINNFKIDSANYFVLDLQKEKSAMYSSLFMLLILFISFSSFYYYQFQFYQAEAAYKDISIKQNRSLESTTLDNQKVWDILNQTSNATKSQVIAKNSYRGEYKIYLSDIYMLRARLAFQEENNKPEAERNIQRITDEVGVSFDYLKEAANASPNNIVFQHKIAAAYFVVARDLGASGADDWAVKKYNKAIELEPTSIVLFTELGKVFNVAGQTDVAITQFEKALSLKKDYIDAGLQLGLSYEKKEETQKAIDTLISMGSIQRIEQAIAAGQIATSQSIDVDIGFQLGRIYYNSDRVSEAKDTFIKIVRINPAHANAHYSLGLIYSSEGDKEKAIKEFEAVLSLNPENEDVKNKINELKGISTGGVKKSETIVTPPTIEPIMPEPINPGETPAATENIENPGNPEGVPVNSEENPAPSPETPISF